MYLFKSVYFLIRFILQFVIFLSVCVLELYLIGNFIILVVFITILCTYWIYDLCFGLVSDNSEPSAALIYNWIISLLFLNTTRYWALYLTVFICTNTITIGLGFIYDKIIFLCFECGRRGWCIHELLVMLNGWPFQNCVTFSLLLS